MCNTLQIIIDFIICVYECIMYYVRSNVRVVFIDIESIDTKADSVHWAK